MNAEYRKNVGMVVFNSKGEVLVGERVNFPGSWQFPQGGIDQEDEDCADAVIRELYEETGIEDGQIVYKLDKWIYYDFPDEVRASKRFKNFKGQMQKWFLIYWDRPVSDCSLDHHEREFREVKFIPLEHCLETIVSFKRKVYEELIENFEPVIQKFLTKG